MTKKLLIAALALLVAAPMALADNGCTTGGTPVPQVIMVGSSAQFNATAYAVQNIITTAGGTFNLFSVKGKDSAGTGLADVVDSPIVVLVNNSDTSGFGRLSGANYVFTNIDREVLSELFQGNLHNTDDLLTSVATAGGHSGPALQVVQREPLSGTFNTFEFTGVRTQAGGNAGSSQENGINPGTNNFMTDPTNCPTRGTPIPQ